MHKVHYALCVSPSTGILYRYCCQVGSANTTNTGRVCKVWLPAGRQDVTSVLLGARKIESEVPLDVVNSSSLRAFVYTRSPIILQLFTAHENFTGIIHFNSMIRKYECVSLALLSAVRIVYGVKLSMAWRERIKCTKQRFQLKYDKECRLIFIVVAVCEHCCCV